MNWNNFTSIKDGTRIHNHGFDQCVALVNLYHADVIGGAFIPVASAHQWWGDWTEVSKHYTRSQKPVAGAIVIWDTSWGYGHGHIGVVTGVNADGTFTTMEQNASPQYRYTHRFTRDMSGVLGFLVPKKSPVPAAKPSGGSYTVKAGDSLSGIAQRYGISWEALYAANKAAVGSNPNVIHAGLKLTIPKTGATRTHTVARGESLSGIASQYGTTWEAIYAANKTAIGGDPNKIYSGLVLTIPDATAPRTYTVKRGDTLGAIASRFGTTWQELARVNSLSNPDVIHAGLVLTIP